MNREIIELREVVTKLVPMLTGKGLTVTQRGADAYVIADPKTRKPVRINIPNIPDTADAGFIRAIQGFIDHEVGHVLITDWDWIAGYRVTPQQMMEKKVQRLRTYHNIIEDTMIEREMERIFPGSKKNIADLRRHFIAKITRPAVASAKDDREAFNYLLVAVMRALAGHTEFQDYMDDEKLWDNKYVKELIDRLPEKVKKDLPKIRTTKETLEIAQILDGILHPIVPPPTITKVEPNQGYTPGGDPVEIHGTNFVDLEWVKFGGSLAKIVAHASGRKIVVETPAHAAGFVDVEVKTEHGQAVKASAFEYLDPPQQPGGGDGDPDDNSGQDQQSDGESQDKPEKEAGEGGGDGERDHSESDDGEDKPGESGEGEKDESEEKASESGDGEEADDDTAEDGEGSDDAEGDRDRDSDEEGTEDGDPEEDQDEGDGNEPSENEGESDQSPDGSDDDDDADQDAEDGKGQKDDDGGADDGAKEEAEASDDGDGDGEDASGQDEQDSDEDDKPGAAEADSEHGDGKQPGEKESTDRLAIQTDDHEAGEVGEADDQDDGSGGGVGNGLGKSLFDFDDNAFEKADLSSQIAILIANEAVDLLADNDYNVFTREFDRIEPLKVPEIHDQWVPDLDEKTRAMTGRMQKDIERMMASQSHVVKVPGYRSGRLHSPALHRIVTNDDRLFNRKQEHKSKDTAVSLLIDNSGSMGGVKIVTAMVAGYALSSTLERVNIANEVIGFTTGDHRGKGSRASQQEMNKEISAAYAKGVRYHRVTPIVMPIYKDFDERINATVKQRIAYMANAQRGMVTNVDGESLEYAAIRLLKRREKRKVMLVLSDGQPSGAANAAGHLKQTVEKLEKLGIDLVGIGIMDAAVRRFYTNHIVLQQIEDLPTQVMQELKKILTN